MKSGCNDLQPTGRKTSNHVTVDETAIRLNDQRYWLYAADSDTNDFLHVRLFSTRKLVLTKRSCMNSPRNTTSMTHCGPAPSLSCRFDFKRSSGENWNTAERIFHERIR